MSILLESTETELALDTELVIDNSVCPPVVEALVRANLASPEHGRRGGGA